MWNGYCENRIVADSTSLFSNKLIVQSCVEYFFKYFWQVC